MAPARGLQRYGVITLMSLSIVFVYTCVRVTLRSAEYSVVEQDYAEPCHTRIIYVAGNDTYLNHYVKPRSLPCTSRDDCGPIRCRALFEGDKEEQDRAKLYMNFNPHEMPPDSALIEATRNCQEFIRENGYPMYPGSEEEASFPIAYSIVLHKDLAQVERLLRAIYQPQNFYCLHIDAKAPPMMHDAAEALVRCFQNVFIATRLERVVYAGVSRLQADINCMRDLHNISRTWRYMINLVGQVFPLKTNLELVNILKIYNGANDIEGLPVWRRVKSRYEKRWKEVIHADGSAKLEKTNDTNDPLPHNLALVRGSAFGVFSQKFVEFIITDEVARELLEWSRYTYSPDEHYWSTLNHVYLNPHLKSPGGYPSLPDRKPWMAMYASWYPRDPCKGQVVRGVCVFGIKDLPFLAERRELFANKFYLNYQYLTMDCLQEWLRNRSAVDLPSSYEFYRSLPFVMHK